VGEGAEFHTKGDRAILTLNGVAAPECVALAAASEDAAPAADIFRARGNEPGWSLTLGPDRFTFTADYGEKIVSGRSPAPVAEGEALVFSSAEHELEIRIEDRLCTDDATGMPHPKTVAASLDGRTYAGCGGAPADLLVGDWRLVEIDGEAVADGIEATMAFAADGRVAGRAACNRYSAQWTLTGESLSIGPAAATKMACLDETAAQTEQRFFAILPSADRFGVDAEGALVIYAADRPILKARR
jgi:heat shock protein HslJ